MDTLYDQLLELQHIPNAYLEWESYRNALTDLILRHTDAGGSITIVGAGACNDFDLQRLSAHFSSIILSDRNMRSMLEGVTRQGVTAAHIQLLQTDLLGIPDDDYRALCDTLLPAIRRQHLRDAHEPDEITALFLSHLQSAFQRRRPDVSMETKAAADYVICCGVHSQLMNLFAQMVGVYQRYANIDTDRIYETVRAMNTVVAHSLNTSLLRMAQKGVLLGLEESRAGMAGGIEGAIQALADIAESGIPIEYEETLQWPFDRSQGKIYTMKLLLLNTLG